MPLYFEPRLTALDSYFWMQALVGKAWFAARESLGSTGCLLYSPDPKARRGYCTGIWLHHKALS